jgi:DNA-binding transcriptional LysR family regulator
MDSRELKYFVETIELGGITKASRSLNITQPALSKSISNLEKKLKCILLERGRFGIRPTEFGEALYLRSKSIITELQRAETELKEMTGGTSSLSIGALPSLSITPVAETLLNLVSSTQKVRIQLIEKPSVDLIPALRRGEFEIALSTMHPNQQLNGLVQTILFYDRPTVVVSKHHPLLDQNKISIEDTLRYGWILPRQGAQHRVILENHFKKHGYSVPQEIIESQSVTFTQALLTKSDFIGILPNHSTQSSGQNQSTCPINVCSQLPERTIGMIHRAGHALPLPFKTFLDKLLSTCEGLGIRTHQPGQ